MEKSVSTLLPEHGQIRFWREVDDGDFSCWWYNIDMTDTQGISFTISNEYETAARFAKQLSDFLSWPLEDQVNMT